MLEFSPLDIEEEGSYNIYIEYNAAIRNSDISYIYRWE
jgi:hypothetical protein